MARIHVDDDRLLVELTGKEKVAGLLRDVTVPLAAVREVVVVEDALLAARGVRAPGLGLPGLRKIGTWRRRGGRQLVVARRGQPAVRVALDGQRYDELVVGVDDAGAAAAEIERHRAEARRRR